ncbi:MAG: hypothetical protein Q9200_007259, partial [Gallowayella weberi]
MSRHTRSHPSISSSLNALSKKLPMKAKTRAVTRRDHEETGTRNTPTHSETSTTGRGVQPRSYQIIELENRAFIAEKESLALRVQLLERQRGLLSQRGHSGQRSDDHYADDIRPSKRASRPRDPDEQPLTHLPHFVNWIRDCERCIDQDPAVFYTDAIKINWSASYLASAKRPLWDTHCDALKREGNPSTWAYYCEYLKNLIKSLELRVIQTEQQLDRAHQQSHQTVAELDQYLTSLYADLDYQVPEAQKISYLRQKIDNRVAIDMARFPNRPTTYQAMLTQYMSIEHNLRATGVMPKIGSSNSQASQSRPRTTRTLTHRGRPAAATTSTTETSTRTQTTDTGLDTKRRYQRALVVTIYFRTPLGECEAKGLIDSGAERNFVSQGFVKRVDLPDDHTVPER